MCYSAQVIQAVRKMYRQLGIRLEYDEAERLFFRCVSMRTDKNCVHRWQDRPCPKCPQMKRAAIAMA